MAVDLGNNTRTAGGYLIKMRGENFGINSDLKVFIGGRLADLVSNTHSSAQIRAAEGQGKGLEIVVTREDLNIPRRKTIAEQTFDYSPPIIYKAESSYGLTFPTSGKTHNDDAIYILIYGDNFGLGDKTEVYFGEKASGIIVKSMVVKHHTFINASVPEGEGLNLTIYVVVANQTGYSLDYFVNYEAPVVSEIRPYDKIVGLPPSGCKTFEDIRERDQNSIGLRCLERAMITIVGENFGRPKRAKLIFTDALSVVRSGKILNSSHTIIQAVLEPGVGLTNITVSLPRNIRNAYEQVSEPFSFTFSKPILHGLVFGPSLEVATISDTFDAQGGYKSGNSRLFFLGENFGEVATEVQIYIDGQRCEDAQHHGWDQFETLFHPWQNSGRPYISCIPQETTVGEKEIYIEVAETSALFTSPRGEESISKIHARCFEGFYGQLNEFCVECWFHNPMSLYSDRKRKVYLSECPGTFEPDFGSNEPLSKPGFAILPPHECIDGVCLFDKKPIVDKIQWIPLSCIPVLVVSIQQNNVGAVIFSFAEDHRFSNDLALTVISIAREHNLYGEQRYTYLSRVLGSKSIQLVRTSDNF